MSALEQRLVGHEYRSRSIETSLIRESFYSMRAGLVDIKGLASSVARHGLLHPLVVRQNRNLYEIIAGHRRFAACRLLGWSMIPCHLVNVSEKEGYEIALIENVQRKSLDPIEEAEAYKRYVIDFGHGGVSELARKVGKSQEYISQRLMLLDLPGQVQRRIIRRQIKPSHATELIWLKDKTDQEMVAEEIFKNKLSLRKVRTMVCHLRQKRNHTVADQINLPSFLMKQPKKVRNKNLANLFRIITVLRSALMSFDCAYGRVEGDKELQNFLLKKRYALHDLLNEFIKFKCNRYGRRRCGPETEYDDSQHS